MSNTRSFKKISMVGYKLFRKNKKGELTSVIVSRGPFKVVYKIREKNYAPRELATNGHYLTFFKRLTDCIDWKNGMIATKNISKKSRIQIWKVQGSYILNDLPQKFVIEELKDGNIYGSNDGGWPIGTFMCRNLILLERVDLRKCLRY